MEFKGVKAIVTDIEGTTSSISFVHEVLFPYARAHLESYVRENADDLHDIFEGVREIENDPALDVDQIIGVLQHWIDTDKKATPLKALQGLIWRKGYEDGDYKGHIYPDALEGLKRWKDQGFDLYVYSSGSVPAQKLLFGYTDYGDLTPLFSGYFDTTTGPKLETESYAKIAQDIGLDGHSLLFLSDHAGEIEAAQQAGLQTAHIERESDAHNALKDFDAFSVVFAS